MEAIGGLEFNTESQSLLVSGYTESVYASTARGSCCVCSVSVRTHTLCLVHVVRSFSVWCVTNGQPTIHSHSHSSEKIQHASGYACYATWFDAETVLSSDNAGGVGLFIQDFE